MKLKIYTHLNSNNLLEMAEVGRFGNFKITVYGKEGPIPHFHFENLGENLKGCIRLDKPEYFKHGAYKDELGNKYKKAMVSWLNSPHKSFGKYNLTNWQVICIYWSDNNQDSLFGEDTPMPDYNKL